MLFSRLSARTQGDPQAEPGGDSRPPGVGSERRVADCRAALNTASSIGRLTSATYVGTQSPLQCGTASQSHTVIASAFLLGSAAGSPVAFWHSSKRDQMLAALPLGGTNRSYPTRTTSVISGTCCLMARSTPILSVIAAEGHPEHAP